MNVGIIGAGAIGMLLAGYLGQNHEIHIYSKRFEKQADLDKVSLIVKREEDPLTVQVNAYQTIKAMPKLKVIFVCVKQTAIDEVLEMIQAAHPHSVLIFIQNGMSHLEKVNQLQQTVYFGLVEHGAKRIAENEIIHSGLGQIKVGGVHKETQDSNLIEELSQKDFPIYYQVPIIPIMQKKLIVNAVINPLTAIFHVKNKAIIENRHILKLAQAICREATQVLNMDYEENWENVRRIAESTGENTSSMLQDIQSERPTEVESILGYLLEQAKVNQPYIDFAYQAILAKERRY